MQNIVWLKAAKVTAIEFFQNTSITGFKLLFSLQNSIFLQIIWIPFILFGIIAGMMMSGFCIHSFKLNPTVSYINTFHQPLSDLPFPAVSICSCNKISAKAIRDYVSSLTFKNQFNQRFSEEFLLKQFHKFGGFYGRNNIDDAYQLQTFLDSLDPSSLRIFNVTDVLAMLSPKCEYMLRKCSWSGTIYPCAELFYTLATPEGYCCVFNYNRPTKQIRKIFSVERTLKLIGENIGLKVLLNTSLNDYFFTKRSTLGFIVQIFNNNIFPDISTGRLREFPISPNTDLLSALTVASLISEEKIRFFKIGQRNCLFRNQLPTEYYSHPECLLRCKLESIRALCNCVPYFTPEDLTNLSKRVIYCSLSHLECLSRYKCWYGFLE